MKMFDSKGMLSIPRPSDDLKVGKSQKFIQVTECYCQHGHNLVNNNSVINGVNGIMLKIKNKHEIQEF